MQRNYVVTSVLEYKHYEYVFFNSGQIYIYIYIYIYISDCIPKNVPADLCQLVIYYLGEKKKEGGGGFLIAEHSGL